MSSQPIRIHKDVRTGVYKGLKWAISDSNFCLKLPEVPEASHAIAFFKSRVEPMAVYMSKAGRPLAWQWSLSKRAWRAVWQDAKVRELE